MANKKWMIFVLTLLILFIAAFIPITYSWLIKSNNSTFTINTGEYEIDVEIYFGTTLVTSASDYYDSTTHLLEINAFNPLSENYIGSLRVVLTITPPIASRLRVKILDEWHLIRTYRESMEQVDEVIRHVIEDGETGDVLYPFTISSSYPYIRDNDAGYYYYNGILNKGQYYQIEFINGGLDYLCRDNSSYYEECYVNFDLLVDVVQANRFSEVWNIPYNFFG